MIPIVDSKTESLSNNSIILPDSQDTLNKNSETFYQIPSTKLARKFQEIKYRYANDPWQIVTILCNAGSRKRKYKNCVTISNGGKSWSMDSSDAAEGHPVNGDIRATDNYEHNTLLRSNREPEKVLLNPTVDEFISTDLQPIEIEKNEFIIAHDESQLQNNNVLLTIQSHDSAKFCEPSQAELDKWKQYRVYNEIEDVGQKCLTGRWVCTCKRDNNTTHLKVRYIIKGFQEKSSMQPNSPT